MTVYGSSNPGIDAAKLMTPANHWAEADFFSDFTMASLENFGDGGISVAGVAADPSPEVALAFTTAVPEPSAGITLLLAGMAVGGWRFARRGVRVRPDQRPAAKVTGRDRSSCLP